MADIKTLQTRIALKHDTWAAWHDETKENLGANLVLLKGEIGFCEIPSGNAEATTAPTVLFKVGDGTTPFKSLKWASALAADVYEWAKASDVVLEGKSIKFVTGSGENRKVVKEIAIPYMTESDVKAITDPLSSRLAAVEAAVGTDSGEAGSVTARLDAAEGKLDDILGHEASEGVEAKVGLIDQALVDAKAYTDEREVEINKYADKAEEDAVKTAKAYTDEREVEITKTTDALAAEDARLEGLIGGNTTAIGTVSDNLAQELLDRAAADKAITDSIGAVTEGKTVVKMIEEAQAAAESNAATAAQGKVDALANGAVAQNASDIAANAAAIDALTKENGVIDGLEAAIAQEAQDRADADALINEKFGAEYNKDNTVASAIAAAQSAAVAAAKTETEGQVKALAEGAVATNASEISRVEGKFDDYVEAQAELAHESRIAAMEAFFEGAAADEGEGENLKNALDTLKEIQEFATSEGTAAESMLKSIDDNAKAIKAVEDIVKDGGSLEVRVDGVESRMSAAEGDIDALQALTAGFGEGETVKAKIEAAAELGQQGIDDAKAAQDAADKAQGEVDALEGVVSTLRDEYDVTKQKALDNAAAIANLEGEFGEGGRVTALEADSHTHSFVESELNKIADGDVAKWNEAYSKRHEHSFVESELNKIVDGDVEKWNTAATNASNAVADLAALTGETGRIKVAENAIDALEAIVGGEDGNVALGLEIDALSAIVNGADGNVTLGGEIDALAAKVNNETTGLVATKAVADDAKSKAENAQSRVSAIEGDYLKMADLFIIDCGTASTVVHEAPKAE